MSKGKVFLMFYWGGLEGCLWFAASQHVHVFKGKIWRYTFDDLPNVCLPTASLRYDFADGHRSRPRSE